MAGWEFRHQLRSREGCQTDGTVAVLSDASRDTCLQEMLSRRNHERTPVAKRSCAVDENKRWRRRLSLERCEPLDGKATAGCRTGCEVVGCRIVVKAGWRAGSHGYSSALGSRPPSRLTE